MSSSKRGRESLSDRSSPSRSESTSMFTCACVDSVRFAVSHARRRRLDAFVLLFTSSLVLRWNARAQCSNSAFVKSSPPRLSLPAVATTSKSPLSAFSSVTSCVAPPMSNTSTYSGCVLFALSSRPYAIAAASGSLMNVSTFTPALSAAACSSSFCFSVACAGMLSTTLSTLSPVKSSARSFRFLMSSATNSTGVTWWAAPLRDVAACTAPSALLATLNDHSCTYSLSITSSWFLPSTRLRWKIVFSACELSLFTAVSPTITSSPSNVTNAGVVRKPWSFAMMFTLPLWNTPTQPCVDPMSMPATTIAAAACLKLRRERERETSFARADRSKNVLPPFAPRRDLAGWRRRL
ncbi:hypothetical protein PybrP1_012440 [[Pythium] brassicae (nom. inval.)]|nr:hypothetical protein PybrP1_012440 [[Pythium] brassicae (nom. inval.)]